MKIHVVESKSEHSSICVVYVCYSMYVIVNLQIMLLVKTQGLKAWAVV